MIHFVQFVHLDCVNSASSVGSGGTNARGSGAKCQIYVTSYTKHNTSLGAISRSGNT